MAWLLLLLVALVALWGYYAYVVPVREVRDALRRISLGNTDSVWHIPRGRLGQMVDDLAGLVERLHEDGRRLGAESINLQTLLGSLSEGVLIVNTAQRVNLVNDSLHRMLDLRVPWRGRTLMEVFRNHTLHDAVLAALEEGTPQSCQLVLDVQGEKGHRVQKHFTLTVAGLCPPGSDTFDRAIAIFHDITELKALETMRRDFVANVSHELRTPLAIIKGYLEALLDGALDDRETAERFLHVMAKHSERLNLLIEDLLSLSQLETRHAGGLNFEPVQLRACLDRVIERLEPHISEKGADVSLDLADPMPPIEADAHRLDQVFFNLIENALKYGDTGKKPQIRISAAVEDEQACICVADNGPGIPQADQPHIFERFYRVHKDRSRAVGGTGLGLSIVKHVVQAHGGQVAVASQPGRGASFRLRMPVSQRN